jgi:hypothetical protein
MTQAARIMSTTVAGSHSRSLATTPEWPTNQAVTKEGSCCSLGTAPEPWLSKPVDEGRAFVISKLPFANGRKFDGTLDYVATLPGVPSREADNDRTTLFELSLPQPQRPTPIVSIGQKVL